MKADVRGVAPLPLNTFMSLEKKRYRSEKTERRIPVILSLEKDTRSTSLENTCRNVSFRKKRVWAVRF